ncbi:MAG TPA: MATE family efflux transporter [Sphaerochaeta sp.]|nr:MATE family efflux transporter [Sphaerochaeta sp.]HQB90532.1 MATE family efflux transporter [Sphaerochaeta sp.]
MKARRQQANLLDQSRPPWAVIITLAWPTIAEQLLQVMVTFVDSAMVGSLGASATASVSVPTSTIWLVNGWMNAFAIGYGVLMARSLGGGQHERARTIVAQSLITALPFSLVLTALFLQVARILPPWIASDAAVIAQAQDYYHWIAIGYLPNTLMILISSHLRLSGDTKTPLFLNAMNNILNIIFNTLFIFEGLTVGGITLPGLGLGVKGAAMATTLACTITAISLLFIIFKGSGLITLSGYRSSGWQGSLHRAALRLAVPVALERTTLSLGQIFYTKLIGTLGTTALAAHFLATTAESITYLPSSGLSTAATTLVAHSLGSGDKALAKRFGDTSLILGTLFMSAMGLVLYFFAHPLLSLFTADEAVITLGAKVLRIEAFAQPAFGLSMLTFGIFRGAGDTKSPFFISLAGMWLVRLPLAWALLSYTTWGLLGVWLAMASDITLRGIICLFAYRHSGWLERYTEQH